MSREVKFKVWDNWNKKFLDFGEVDIWDLIFEEPKLIEEIYTDGMANECLEFLQFTGLLDKNGVEIYEGDIIEGKNEFGEIKITYIIYNKDNARFEGKKSIGYSHKDIKDLLKRDSIVIGNIYENKELNI